jgi:hypothetical protein
VQTAVGDSSDYVNSICPSRRPRTWQNVDLQMDQPDREEMSGGQGGPLGAVVWCFLILYLIHRPCSCFAPPASLELTCSLAWCRILVPLPVHRSRGRLVRLWDLQVFHRTYITEGSGEVGGSSLSFSDIRWYIGFRLMASVIRVPDSRFT